MQSRVSIVPGWPLLIFLISEAPPSKPSASVGPPEPIRMGGSGSFPKVSLWLVFASVGKSMCLEDAGVCHKRSVATSQQTPPSALIESLRSAEFRGDVWGLS